MKKLIFALLLAVPCCASAKDFNAVLKALNSALNPVGINEVGYEVEYREETGTGWINIVRVKRTPVSDPIFYLSNGEVTSSQPLRYLNYWDDGDDGKGRLTQITCEGGNLVTCKQALARELSVEAVKKVLALKIRDVVVKAGK